MTDVAEPLREAVCECYQAVSDQYAEIAAPSDH